MNFEDFKLLVSFAATGIGLISALLVFMQKFFKNSKLNKTLKKSSQILNEIIPIIAEAEKFSNYSGKEKKEYVMTKLNQYAINNKMIFNEEIISNKIEDLINLSKNVNSKKTFDTENNNIFEDKDSELTKKKINQILESYKE